MAGQQIFRGTFQKIFLVVLVIQALRALFRDLLAGRYASFGDWFRDIVPATLGLILSAALMSGVVYALYMVYRKVFKKKAA